MPSPFDNRANQLNPNNLAFWRSRGFDSIPTRSKSGCSFCCCCGWLVVITAGIVAVVYAIKYIDQACAVQNGTLSCSF